jgi:RNA polymerase sigma factor (sigma-70 family)
MSFDIWMTARTLSLGYVIKRMSTRPNTSLASKLALRYRAPLISYFRRRGVDRDACEDLTHEVFARVSRRSVNELGNAEAYVFSSASSVYIDHVRRRKSHFADMHRDLDGLEFESEAPGPSRVLEGKQALERLSVILEELPHKTREILLLSRVEGLSNTQLATRFCLSTSAIEKHLARGLLHVRKRYADHG